MGKRAWRWGGIGLLLLAALGHAGAPYPVLVDEPAGPYTVSALADPDVGLGTFYITVLAGGAPAPEGTAVTVAVRPADGHVPEATYPAARRPTRDGDRFEAEVPFDARGPWQIRIEIDGPAGAGQVAFPVQVTSPGLSWLTALACLLPFALLGALWIRSARKKPRR